MTRCEHCGNPRHSFFAYALGWLAFRLAMLWPYAFGFPPRVVLATAGDYVYDKRGCAPCPWIDLASPPEANGGEKAELRAVA